MNLRDTYNRIAADWDNENGGKTWSTPRVQMFATYFLPSATILDAGCGPGHKAKELAECGLRVHGFDFSEEMVKIARTAVPEATFAVGDLRTFEATEQYNGILALASLLHVPKPEVAGVMQRLWSCLRTGGYMFALVKERPDGMPEEEDVTKDNYGYEYSRLFTYFTMPEFKQYFLDLGAEIMLEERFPIGHTVWLGLIVKK